MIKRISTTMGVLLLASTVALAAQHGRPSFEDFDTDDDGRLSEQELDAMPSRHGLSAEQRMQRMDADGDGYVSKEELQSMARRGGGGQRMMPAFDELDADGDGRLSEAEMNELPTRGKGTPSQRFDHLDMDDDGYVTREELQNMPRRGGRPQ